MLRRVLFVSTLMLAGTFGFVNSAKAAELDMPFEGTIVGGCTLNKTANGTLIKNAAGNGLTSTGTGAAAGTFTVNCDAAASVSVALPDQGAQDLAVSPKVNPTETTIGEAIVKVTGLAGEAKASDTSEVAIPDTELNKDLAGTVDMDAGITTGALAAGKYTYIVKVTAVPD